jgi:hypothetical protein
VRGICGFLNSDCVVRFDVGIPEVNHIDGSNKFPLIKGSKTHEKGSCLKFEDTKYNEAVVNFTGIDNKLISVKLTELKTKPLLRIYCKLPNPDLLEVSELYLEGNFEVESINLANQKTIAGDVFEKKLYEQKSVTIDKKLFIDVIGEPLVKQKVIETEFGDIHRVSNKLNVEI